MKNIIAIVSFFILVSFSSLSQTIDNNSYKLYSLENKENTVRIKLDDVNQKISIELNPSQMMCINGFMDLEQEIKVLNQKFIELRFRIRGGSGVANRRYILICISDNKLYRAIDVISTVRSQFKETYVPKTDSLNLYDESSIYRLGFTISQCDDQNYKLITMEYENIKSKYDSKQNHETQNTMHLNFDVSNKVFYSHYSNLIGGFVIDNDNGSQSIKKDFKGELYPIIKFKNGEYYFINESWYFKDGKDHLTEFSSICK